MATDATVNEQRESAPAKTKSKAWIVVLILMALEGAAIYFGTKFVVQSGPAPAAADEGQSALSNPSNTGVASLLKSPDLTEVELAECRPVNKSSGKLITFKMRLSALVKTAEGERAKTLIEANKARINDRINFVIRSAEIAHLNEPSMETIKRRFKMEIDRVLGDAALIQEILIPEMIPSGSGL